MSDGNDIIARRRELRRRKILENAETRKQKIFGVNSALTKKPYEFDNETKDITSSVSKTITALEHEGQDDKDETASTKSTESGLSSRSEKQDGYPTPSVADDQKLKEIKNIPDPALNLQNESHEITMNSLNDSPLNCSNFYRRNDEVDSSTFITSNAKSNLSGSLLSNGIDKSFNVAPCVLLSILEHPASPFFLGLLVSLLLYLNLGNLVSHSLIIPFGLWEIQQIIASCGALDLGQEKTSLFETVIYFCGIPKTVIFKYIWLLNLSKDILEDFAIYIVTVVLWQTFIGFSHETSIN